MRSARPTRTRSWHGGSPETAASIISSGTAKPDRSAIGEHRMKIGFIGLGMMGKGMAANLQKAGHQLVVHDIRRAAADPYIANGAVWADSPKALAEQVEAVFTSLPVPIDVESVALGPNGLIEGMKPDTALFDMSTNSVAV